ncbi:pyridoxal 5'-phosphate synthase glutaminase subunit PdxT [Myxococcota bacterium]|nr:pyridoxal 5'-phosphate synthase glutaminase subunit PdxT [Myxococcota bacterium]
MAGRRVGILGIQGAVEKHVRLLAAAGASSQVILRPEELECVDALILPGGESSTISKGMARLGLLEPIREFVRQGRPVLGTCAGAILLAKRCRNHPVPTLGLLDVTACRNAYGTQVDSFSSPADPGGEASVADMRCVFIRAPRLEDLGPDVEVLLRVDDWPVLVRQAGVLASTFHPELADDPRVHRLLLA